MRIGVHFERQLLVLRFVTERTRDHLQQSGEENFFGIDGHGAGFDLREVENVGDEVEQIGSGAVDGAREFNLLAGEIAFGVVAELLAQYQNTS